ncbi:hypothetical protein [Gordonia insulae]|uniref:Uncharacterized protein n=1 Tax=Gordonia insulae TaxID=2420509 RepID=A0A3G8JNL9_9ACTN|nr:hypothetical protein [Gordonia insulae]AZG46548.1 hypothetical protein D7316_03149 [Gordonia insulae]
MVCCVVAAFVLLIAQRVMPWRSRCDDGGFAPVATRTGSPGSDVEAPSTTAVPELDQRSAALSWTARSVAASTAVYLVAAAALLASGLGADTGTVTAWVVRSLALVATIVVLLHLSTRIRRRGYDPSTRAQIVGYGAMGAGIAGLGLMVIDMHLLHLYHVHGTVAHLVMQGLPVLAVFGGMLFVACPDALARPALTARAVSSKSG